MKRPMRPWSCSGKPAFLDLKPTTLWLSVELHADQGGSPEKRRLALRDLATLCGVDLRGDHKQLPTRLKVASAVHNSSTSDGFAAVATMTRYIHNFILPHRRRIVARIPSRRAGFNRFSVRASSPVCIAFAAGANNP